VYKITNENFKKYGQQYLLHTPNSQYEFNKNLKHINKISIDHKYSIKQGFIDKISPEIIGSIVNLEILSFSKNSSKQEKCSISLQTLLNNYNKFLNENKIN